MSSEVLSGQKWNIFSVLSLIFNILFSASLFGWPIILFLSGFAADDPSVPSIFLIILFLSILVYPILVISSFILSSRARNKLEYQRALLFSFLPLLTPLIYLAIAISPRPDHFYDPSRPTFNCGDNTILVFDISGAYISRYTLNKKQLGRVAQYDASTKNIFPMGNYDNSNDLLNSCKNAEGKTIFQYLNI